VRSASDDAAAAAKVAADAASAAQRQQDIHNGTISLSGSYQVGVGVQPGTFVPDGRMTNCYWETLGSTGSTIDNAFILSALRAEVVILSTDYSFSSRGCGGWKRVGM